MTAEGSSRSRGRPEGVELPKIGALRQYGAILADPPWKFKAYAGPRLPQRSAHAHYALMSHDELCSINLPPLLPDCALFMWVVDSHLDQGIEIMSALGFAFKTIAFVWVKTQKHSPQSPRMGMGLWTRKGAEVCLLGTRGKPKRKSGGVRQVIMAPRREHSRKPDEIYGRIEALVAGPYVELFSRQRRPGWDQALSNETDKFS